jgi:hypothetical protein
MLSQYLIIIAWHVLRLQIGDGLDIWGVAAMNILTKQLQVADKK